MKVTWVVALECLEIYNFGGPNLSADLNLEEYLML